MSYKQLFDLTGKNAIVAGGGSGIGEGICEGLADFGANVAVVDLRLDDARRVSGLVKDRGVNGFAVGCDVSNSAQVKAAVQTVDEAFGGIDILVNCAGISQRHDAATMPDDVFDSIMRVNLYGVFYFCREAGARMVERGKGGRVINIASISAHVGLPGTANYAASKGGVLSLSRCLATEWAPHNILVNAISPTHVKTKLIEKVIAQDPSKEEFFKNNILLGRMGEVKDVVGAAVYLASEAGALVTGTTLIVDGGHSARGAHGA